MTASDQKTAVWSPAHCAPQQAIPNELRAFLFDLGSTTQRMQQEYAVQVEVNILQQQWRCPHEQEARRLNIPAQRQALIREVYLSCQNKTWMYARTVFPKRFFTGKTRYLEYELNERPLGKLLFSEPTMRRGAFEFAMLQPDHLEHAWASRQYKTTAILWARRSIFWIQEKPLLLMEVFFPEILSLEKAIDKS